MGCSTTISPTTALACTLCLLPWQHPQPHMPLEFEVRIYKGKLQSEEKEWDGVSA